MIELRTKDELDALLKSNEFVVIDFWATWCGPCRMLLGVIEDYELSHPEAIIAKINVDEAQDLAADYEIQTLPTLLAFRNGTEVASYSGFLSKSNFLKFMEEALSR